MVQAAAVLCWPGASRKDVKVMEGLGSLACVALPGQSARVSGRLLFEAFVDTKWMRLDPPYISPVPDTRDSGVTPVASGCLSTPFPATFCYVCFFLRNNGGGDDDLLFADGELVLGPLSANTSGVWGLGLFSV